MVKKKEKPIENDPNVIYADTLKPIKTPTGLKSVNATGDVFLDKKGSVWSLEFNKSKGCRELVKHCTDKLTVEQW